MKEIRSTTHFQLIQHKNNSLELRLTADDKESCFTKAKQAIGTYLQQNGVVAEIFLSDNIPSVSPTSGKYRHIIAKD